MYKLDLEKAEEPEIKLPTSAGSQKKQGNSRKDIYFCFIDYGKAFDCVYDNKPWKILRDGNTRPPYLPPEKPVIQVKKKQLALDMEQRIGSKLGKEYLDPVYLTYMQSTSYKMPGWLNHKLN